MVKRAYHRPDHLLVSVLDMARIKRELYPLTSSFLHLLVGTAMKTVTPVIGMDRQIRWDRFFYYECFVNVGIANNFLTRERRTRQTPGYQHYHCKTDNHRIFPHTFRQIRLSVGGHGSRVEKFGIKRTVPLLNCGRRLIPKSDPRL